MTAKVDAELCTGCGACEGECPTDAIEVADAIAVISADDCTDCGACVDECPTDAISME